MINTIFYFTMVLAWVFCSYKYGRVLIYVFPRFRARKLTMEEKEEIRRYGLNHCTTEPGCDGILRDRRINPSRHGNAYSTFGKPCVYFCLNDKEVGAEDGFNKNSKYKKKITVQNLTDQQIENMRRREHDGSIIHMGSFDILESNTIAIEDVVSTYRAQDFKIDVRDPFLWANLFALIVSMFIFGALLFVVLCTCRIIGLF